MAEPLIFHIDVNSAYLSWEALELLKQGGQADLRLIPSAVGGDRATRHGVILAKSPLAKRAGVRTGEPVAQALKKCPDLVLVPPHHELYSRRSRQFIETLRRFAPVVEQVSIDEAFADMSGTESLYGSPLRAAALIRDTIFQELGFTVNVGISRNKLLAKMASDFEKPGKIHTLFPEEIPSKMWPLPVEELYSAGESAARKLHSLGIHTIGQLAATAPALLRAHMKKQGELLYDYANGRGDAQVLAEEPDSKVCGNSTTLSHDVTDPEEAKLILLSLSETVCSRLRAVQKKGSCVTVQMTDCEFQNRSHQRTVSTATDVTGEVHAIACSLFDALWDGSPLRLLGVSVSHLTEEAQRQYNMFDMDKYDRLNKLDHAIDSIRERYGSGAVKRACFLDAQKKSSGPS
ncbi:DNA polymerase Y family protein [Cuneatibacter caecimuris]|uniref:DNA polymerase IV n=1 Tax=Cuneatibacter caecimuris TaxID=1796618 RepID=A0A4Q7P0C6_9FIRM|nr:DNA polymerase IV [Cuneatibacter caecimuris]RZS92718.1 DNA polymerase-4 [Cuneatibacter caecimuris]